MTGFVEVQTPDNVILRYKLAGPGSRVAAGIIDLCIIWTAIGLILLGLLASGQISVSLANVSVSQIPANFSQIAVIILGIAIFVLNIFYFILFDYLNSGQTIGKRTLGIQVKSYTGHAVSIESACVRNFARILDVLPGLYLAGLISALFTRSNQRIGDLIAGTIVIRKTELTAPNRIFANETYAQLSHPHFPLNHSQITQLDRAALTLLEAYFQRAQDLGEQEYQELRASLVSEFAVVLVQGEVPNEQEDIFLKEVYLCVRDHWTH